MQNTLDNFKVTLGMPLDEEVIIAANISVDTVNVDIDLAIDHALQKRGEIRQREIAIINSQYSLLRTKSNDSFKGEISATVGLIGDNGYENNAFRTTDNENVSVSLSVPLFDWGARKARTRAAKIGVESSELALENLEKDIKVSIRSSYRTLQNNIIQINIADKSLRLAELTYDINLERYKNGDLTSLDLEKIQEQLSTAKMSRTNAIIDYKIELLNLKILSLYDFENDQAYIPEEIYKLAE